MWYLAHRLELTVKDTLKGKTFDNIDDMLLKLYYVFTKKLLKMQRIRRSCVRSKGLHECR